MRYFMRETLIDPIKWRRSIMQIFLNEIERRDLIFVIVIVHIHVNRSKPDIVPESRSRIKF